MLTVKQTQVEVVLLVIRGAAVCIDYHPWVVYDTRIDDFELFFFPTVG